MVLRVASCFCVPHFSLARFNLLAVKYTLIKMKIKFSSYIRKFRMEQLPSHTCIWQTASSYIGKYLRTSSYIGEPFLIYDFATAPLWISLYMRKFDFLLYQCTLWLVEFITSSLLKTTWKPWLNTARQDYLVLWLHPRLHTMFWTHRQAWWGLSVVLYVYSLL